MLQKLKTVLKDSKVYRLEECVIDSLMRLECKHVTCMGCLYDLCDIEEEGIICVLEVNDALYGIR